MEQGINFYELKTQLADLGFKEPAITDQLREAMYTTSDYATLHTSRDNLFIQINLDKAYPGTLEFNTYDAVLASGGQLRDQVFAADVPVNEALHLLTNRFNRPDVTADIAGTPMNRQHVRVSLGLNPNEENIHPLNLNIMNTQNLEFLKKTLLNLGFGEKLNADLEKKIDTKTPEFTLNTQHEFSGKQVDYNLHFKAGDEMYFFNKFDASFKNGKDEQLNQSFYINKGNGVTAKEAFNLMEGRAVHKQLYNQEGEKYTAWLKLDKDNLTEGGNMKFRSWNENYGFKPEEVLAGKGIKEMDGGQAQDKLLRSLRKGNAQQITVSTGGAEKKYYITANPQFKTVDLYDQKMNKIKREELLKPESTPSKSQKQTEQQKEGLPAKKQGRRHKQAV